MYKKVGYYLPRDTRTLNVLNFIILQFTHTTMKISTYEAPATLALRNEIEVEIETPQKNITQIEELLEDLV